MDYSYLLKTVHLSGGQDLTKHLDKSLLCKQDTKEMLDTMYERELVCKDLEKIGDVGETAKRAIRFDNFYKQHMLNKKDQKIYASEIRPWIAENKSLFEKALQASALTDKLTRLNRAVEAFETAYVDNLRSIAKFLTEIGYLNGMSTLADLKPENLTVKGVMAMEVNECNPLMLTELVHGPYLDNLDLPDIVSTLAIFLDVSGERRDVHWTTGAGSTVTKFLRAMDEIEVKESRSSPVISEWTINEYLCDLARLWVSSETGLPPMLKELNITDLQPGEFVRMMLKLDNICKEVASIAKICGKDRIVKELDGHTSRIIRNIVTPQSLYVGY
jgi:superfamily II RNA helicase